MAIFLNPIGNPDKELLRSLWVCIAMAKHTLRGWLLVVLLVLDLVRPASARHQPASATGCSEAGSNIGVCVSVCHKPYT